jgi:hypothetical protein
MVAQKLKRFVCSVCFPFVCFIPQHNMFPSSYMPIKERPLLSGDNIVSLVGHCKDGQSHEDGKYLALVYEHMSEGNLNDKLRGALLHLYERHIFTLVQRSRHYWRQMIFSRERGQHGILNVETETPYCTGIRIWYILI